MPVQVVVVVSLLIIEINHNFEVEEGFGDKKMTGGGFATSSWDRVIGH
jgi:hypothetical protein